MKVVLSSAVVAMALGPVVSDAFFLPSAPLRSRAVGLMTMRAEKVRCPPLLDSFCSGTALWDMVPSLERLYQRVDPPLPSLWVFTVYHFVCFVYQPFSSSLPTSVPPHRTPGHLAVSGTNSPRNSSRLPPLPLPPGSPLSRFTPPSRALPPPPSSLALKPCNPPKPRAVRTPPPQQEAG